MTQRHDHDTIERLWPGAADPKDLRYVPIELRTLVADIPADVESRLRKELYITREVVVTDGRQALRTLNPSTDEGDLETCLVVAKNRWARQQLTGEREASEQAARDAAAYTCQCCHEVVLPDGSTDRHSHRRRFADGSSASVCGRCATVAERLAVDRLAADVIDGKTRADRCRTLLEAQP